MALKNTTYSITADNMSSQLRCLHKPGFHSSGTGPDCVQGSNRPTVYIAPSVLSGTNVAACSHAPDSPHGYIPACCVLRQIIPKFKVISEPVITLRLPGDSPVDFKHYAELKRTLFYD